MREKFLKAFGSALAVAVVIGATAMVIGAASALGVVTYRHALTLLGG